MAQQLFKDENYMVTHIFNEYSDSIVTLAYDRTQYDAPIVLAKRKDATAFIKASQTYDVIIPLFKNSSLTEYLYHNVKVGEEIYEGLYHPVAEIFASVMEHDHVSCSLASDYNEKHDKTGLLPSPTQLL